VARRRDRDRLPGPGREPDGDAVRQADGRREPPPEPPRHPGLATLGGKHRRTLEAIFETPTRSDIRWKDIESLIVALGGTVTSGRGSRRRILLVRPAVFHMPHPEPTTDKGAVKDMREYLRSVGVVP
jgi:hypothetical protein